MMIVGNLARKWTGMAPLFVPEQGITVIEPPGEGQGYWAGAPGIIYDDQYRRFYLSYRLRRPRGMEPDRGYEVRIAESTDGVNFQDIWRLEKGLLGSLSMERACIVKTLHGRYNLYISYVDPTDNRWRVDVIKANSPREFDPKERRKVFTAADMDSEGVKDPYIFVIGGLYYGFFSYAPRLSTSSSSSHPQEQEMHGTGDVFNTGLIKSHTGLAVSSNGLDFRWIGDVLSPSADGWDRFESRISTILYMPPVFTAFYDGCAGVEENYEERAGLAISFDLEKFHKVSEGGPILVSPNASGSLRYIDGIWVGDEIYYYYEYARPDGSHELRMAKGRVN